jgi:hypothetical protein
MTSFAQNRKPRWATARAAALLAVAATAAAAAPSAAAAQEPWGFEQITPPNKGAGVLLMTGGHRPSADGDTLFYSARSPFDGAPTESAPQLTRYVARRGADGWHNRGVDPALGVPSYITSYATLASSGDASHVLVASTLALTPGATDNGGNIYMRDTGTGALTLVATSANRDLAERGSNPFGALAFTYVANDGRSAQFSTTTPLVPDAPGSGLYTWTAEGGIELQSILPNGDPVSGNAPGGMSEAGTRDAMPDDDRALDHVYFGAYHDATAENGGVYVRSGGETRAVSVSRIPGDPATPVPGVPVAVSAGGRYVTFHTHGLTPLTEDTPTDLSVWAGTYIYRYDVVEDSLVFVGVGGPQDSVLQMTLDGQTVAFMSLAEQAPGGVDNQNNLYVWRDGEIRHVAAVDPGSSAEYSGGFLRLLSPNGRYLAFTDNSVSTAQSFGLDNVSMGCPSIWDTSSPGPCDQVYLFDADAEELTCASCRTDGEAPRGHAGDPGRSGFIQTDHRQMQTVTDAGEVFFTSPDALLTEDVNGNDDAYAFRDGEWRLISRGKVGTKSRFQDATPDGKTLFFATTDAIADTDVDNSYDMYMTRRGAGFPSAGGPVGKPCAGADCRDPFSPAGPLPLAGSVSFAGPGNVAAGARASKVRVSRVKAIVGSVGTLRVRVSGKGRLTATGAGLRRVSRSTSKAGVYTVRVSLTAKARKALRKSKSVRRKAKLTFRSSDGRASSVTVPLTYKLELANKKGRK